MMKANFNDFLTFNNKVVDLENFTEDMINVNDIFHSLSMINRFVGHSTRPYSVAEHSIYCYLIAKELGFNKDVQKFALMHDAAEAYISDIPTYVKALLPEIKMIENKIEDVLFTSLFGRTMTEAEKKTVKAIDNTMMLMEMRDLTQHDIKNLELNDRPHFADWNSNGRMISEMIDLEFTPLKHVIQRTSGVGEEFVSTTNVLSETSVYPELHEKVMKYIFKNL